MEPKVLAREDGARARLGRGGSAWALSPWSEAKQSMTAMFSHRASTSCREPSSGRTSPFPGPRRSRSSRLRNRWWGATSQVTGSPRAFAALISRIWGRAGRPRGGLPPGPTLQSPRSQPPLSESHGADVLGTGSRLPCSSPAPLLPPRTTLITWSYWESNRGTSAGLSPLPSAPRDRCGPSAGSAGPP